MWLQCADRLTASPNCSMSLQEVRQIASECGVSDREDSPIGYIRMLQLLNDKGIVMWHQEESLRSVVIIDPTVYLVKPLTIIICNYYQHGTDPTDHFQQIHKDCQIKYKRAFLELSKKGRLFQRVLEYLLKDYKQHFDVLLELMKKFGFLVELLPPKEEVDTGKVDKGNIISYAISFLIEIIRASIHRPCFATGPTH